MSMWYFNLSLVWLIMNEVLLISRHDTSLIQIWCYWFTSDSHSILKSSVKCPSFRPSVLPSVLRPSSVRPSVLQYVRPSVVSRPSGAMKTAFRPVRQAVRPAPADRHAVRTRHQAQGQGPVTRPGEQVWTRDIYQDTARDKAYTGTTGNRGKSTRTGDTHTRRQALGEAKTHKRERRRKR